MKLSIITVNLNNRDGLRRTIDSVVNQTFTDYEWIVIDGGSTDGSRELIEQYQDHFAHWCCEPDNGIYNAMNKGITHANGEWIQFLNSGDWFYQNDVLQKIFSQTYSSDVLYGDAIYTDGNEEKPHICPDTLGLSYLYSNFLNHQSTFYKRIIFEEYKYNESNQIYSDWELSLKLLLDGKLFQHLPFYIVYYDLNGISTNTTQVHINEHDKIAKEIIPFHLRTDMERMHSLCTDMERMCYLLPLADYCYLKKHKSFRLIIHLTKQKLKVLNKIIIYSEKIRKKNSA